MIKFVQKPKCAENARGYFLFALYLVAGLLFQSLSPAQAEPIPLHLEVHVNGHSTQLIAAFEQHEDGRFSATLSELQELGLKANGASPVGGKVFLNDIGGLSFKYNEAEQTLFIETSNSNRLAKNYAAGQKQDRLKTTKSDFGAVVNYSINTSGSSNLKMTQAGFNGVSALLDVRSFGRYGVLSSSFIVDSEKSGSGIARRLSSSWSYADEDRMMTYTIGDIVTGGPSWARPARLGGFRINRNFLLRPDLITRPVANVSGSAAVPSTVDVYVNNVKAHSQEVAPGPFTLSNIPSISGNGTARIVVRDATGRETVTYSDFFLSPTLLAAGLWDFSAELGFARGNYSERSFDYSTKPYFSGSVRYGWQDKATLDGHVEAGMDLLLAGGGISLPVANKALFSFSGAGSFHKNGSGFLAAASVETNLFGLSINARSQRTFGDFKDIAAITASDFSKLPTASGSLLSAGAFPKAIDQISIGLPFPKWQAAVNMSFVHTDSKGSKANNVLAASISKSLFGNASLYGTAFTDIKDFKNPSLFVGLSIPLGKLGSVSAGGAQSKGQGWRATTTYSKPMRNEVGSFGWRVQDQEGATSIRNGAVSYRGSAMTVEGRLSQTGKDLEYSAYVDGAVALTKSGVFATNRIDDSFAVVNVGVPDVPVLVENRVIGRTNSSGTFLIPSLHSFDRNKIAIDPSKLPVNASIPKTTTTVIPSYRSGVLVNFGIQTQTSSAIVIVHDVNGKPLEAGTAGKSGEEGNEVVAGFDGRVFVEKLSAHNKITFETKAGFCDVVFDFQQKEDTQMEVGPVICR